MTRSSILVASCIAGVVLPGMGQASPLLAEDGTMSLVQSAVLLGMFSCGALAIALVGAYLIRPDLNSVLLALALVLAMVAGLLPAMAQSPLEVVMDGRAAAETSNLTESGMRTLAQSGANIILFVCGAVAIALTALGLFELYQASDGDVMMQGGATKAGGVWKLVIAGLVSIPAVIAAILPYAVL